VHFLFQWHKYKVAAWTSSAAATAGPSTHKSQFSIANQISGKEKETKMAALKEFRSDAVTTRRGALEKDNF
jgi:hypothetical protein